MAQLPALPAKRIEDTVDLVLGAGPDSAARRQGQPTPDPETENDREGQEQRAGLGSAAGHDQQPESGVGALVSARRPARRTRLYC